jgi:hypothetical protein
MAFLGANKRVSPMSLTTHLATLPEASLLWTIPPEGNTIPPSPDEIRSSDVTSVEPGPLRITTSRLVGSVF